MEKRNLTCIGCPMGCALTVTIDDDGKVLDVTGNTCARGDIYGRDEVTNPTRTLTTSVRVSGAAEPMVSVKTREVIPKAKLLECQRALADVSVFAPVHIGDVVAADICGTGVDVVATKNVKEV